jgi:hypothetical protein
VNENTEVRDELARLAGWKRIGSVWVHGEEQVEVEDHPIPNTLDHAAKLPEGWGWDYMAMEADGMWYARAYRPGETLVTMRGPTELAARFALRLAVEKIEHERRGGQP